MIEPQLEIFALFGNPVAHSLSPVMHNAALGKMNIHGRYIPFRVESIEDAVRGIRGLDIRGVSVTIPFKTAVMEYLDEIDDEALEIGAVNTIVNEGGRLTGHNTDWQGIIITLGKAMEIKGKTFVVLGAGGTARAALFGILRGGGRPVIVNRTREKGEQLAKEWGCPFYPLEERGKIAAEVLINTTSVGMAPDTGMSPIPPELLTSYRWVMDVIYNPVKTKLLRDAEDSGCITLSGLDMFVHQGAEQLKLWTGQEPPRDLMRQVVQERLIAKDRGSGAGYIDK
ncbi:MAG: shikimate dehydrogenase [Syntrophaceae bacterium CG2_30_49_12]|nr:MAG: shikimate dehydrogenase [Syntrophaceae bacterium CG2_30_49_12]PIP05324.1 MAG: shikimate dehydrogenase [Syntrophobacterales bacterium CG23_combo_of_CG06-09_8_20_14_all_48_27]PJA49584.1 MAG: shikimate dehydrogenase [Syntrophobacterales bacterium CG_4_9_14_3_um_filter_49_8]PJC76598.1 MAG: shikimate dehydrogenase [Syntrophobacterales bacterium CG_4_8_14_3_um_filter_49_14]